MMEQRVLWGPSDGTCSLEGGCIVPVVTKADKHVAVTGRPSVLRHMNALHTLEVLRGVKTCSRADLVRRLGLSAPTVTSVIRALEMRGLVEPLGEGVSKGGRPPDMMRFRAERGCLAAVQISGKELRLLLTDLNGRELGDSIRSIGGQSSKPEAVSSAIAEELRKLLRMTGQEPKSLLALVAGVPAIVDAANGVVIGVSTLGDWSDVPLLKMLRRRIRCNITVENDTNLAALGEQLRGAARGQTSFALVSIGQNVSAGILLHGRLHHGAQWSAGEIGYLRLPGITRRLPAMHTSGELERVLTVSGLLHDWDTGQAIRHSADDEMAQAKAVLDLAGAGSGAGRARARRLIRMRASLVVDAVVNLAVILNPALVVLAGPVGSHRVMFSEVQAQLAGSEFAVPPMVRATLGEDATLWGAIAVALRKLPELLLPEAGSAESPNAPVRRRPG